MLHRLLQIDLETNSHGATEVASPSSHAYGQCPAQATSSVCSIKSFEWPQEMSRCEIDDIGCDRTSLKETYHAHGRVVRAELLVSVLVVCTPRRPVVINRGTNVSLIVPPLCLVRGFTLRTILHGSLCLCAVGDARVIDFHNPQTLFTVLLPLHRRRSPMPIGQCLHE